VATKNNVYASKYPVLLKNKKNELDSTYYFIVLLIGLTRFGHNNARNVLSLYEVK